MNQKLIIFIVFSLTLFSCQDPSQPCEESFIASYRAVQSAYSDLYDQNAGVADRALLKTKVEEFLSDHRDVQCTLDGSVVDVTGEADALISELDGKISKSVSKVVYGVDNRVDVDDSSNDNFRAWAEATAAMIPNFRIGGGGVYLSQTLGNAFSLCNSERFYDQIVPATCSGFLIGPDTLVTAGHCVTSISSCSSYKWVFNFRDGDVAADPDQTYTCVELLGREQNNSTGADYAVVRLDREVSGITPLKFRVQGKVTDGANLVVIGHPSGLPAKIADGSTVRSNTDSKFFVANLDTFGGNSGSAVFDAETGMVEGILVRGETDYVWNGSCYVVNTCSESGCGGEDVTRMTSLTGIPEELLVVDGGWTDWSKWSSCSGGIQSRVRTCTNPVPSNGGDACVGSPIEEKECINFTLEQVFAGVYDSRTFSEYTNYGLINYLGFQQENYVLLGREFFGMCGMHSAQASDQSWVASQIVPCSERNSLQGVYGGFEDLVLGD